MCARPQEALGVVAAPSVVSHDTITKHNQWEIHIAQIEGAYENMAQKIRMWSELKQRLLAERASHENFLQLRELFLDHHEYYQARDLYEMGYDEEATMRSRLTTCWDMRELKTKAKSIEPNGYTG
jgi:hypothetical protein